MIHDVVKDRVSQILDSLDRSKFHFYLTGSRCMGCEGKNSDWDFFTTYNMEVVSFLRSFGFVSINELDPLSSYGYPEGDILQELKYVLRHPIGIDVQLVFDANKKKTIQDKITPILSKVYHLTLPIIARKNLVRWIWRTAYVATNDLF